MNDLITVSGVRGYIDKNETAQLNLEDVARGLGFTQTKNSAEYVRWETVFGYLADFGFSQQVGKEGYVPENIFYRLSMRANNQTAISFQEKVANEILPSIRKHGAYMTPQKIEEVLLNPDTIIKIATQLKEERQRRQLAETRLEEQRPKVIFAEALEVSNNTILIGELAKILRQNGITIGQNRLFEKLREDGYLLRKGESYNQPSQYSMELGLFEIKKRTINNPDGSVRATTTTKVTGKGQIYFINKFKNAS